MNSSDNLQQLQSLLGEQNGASSLTNPFSSMIDQFMPMLQLILVLSIVVTVVIVVYFVVNTIQKQRQHAAIMRIDKNLQKLVEAQGLGDTPKEDPAPTPAIAAE